jgi:translation initiation factor IF-2
MQKIRINELARELEVKAHLILELLPTLGVTDKKTHSSSLDDDIAEKVRRHFQNGGAAHVEEAAVSGAAPPASAAVSAGPAAATEVQRATPSGAHPSHPLRAPLRAPIQIKTRSQVASPAAAPPEPAPLIVEETPPPPAPPVAAGGTPGAHVAKPIPEAPPPGLPATGPRAPLPPPSAPQTPPSPVKTPPAALRPPVNVGQQPAARTRPVAGQPPLRPVVPPRPDLAAKLQQQPPPTPGMPTRRPLTPTPGQPIFQRPGGPGQPPRPGMPARPGMPQARSGSPAGGARPGARPMHPTSRTPRLGPGVAPPPPQPVEQQRRPQHRTTAQRTRDREREMEAKIMHRHAQPRVQEPAEPPPITREITISEGITVKELAAKLGVTASAVIKKLVDKGVFATINQTLDGQTIADLARAFGASTTSMSFEEEAQFHVELAEDPKDLQPRAPVVTIMGHVDHGKTSLLDAIRETNVAAREAGGITQAIGAYQVEQNGRKIVFIDTPGHEAFTRMRARGAKVTDIVVLVVAADDGVMPQTLEAIDHARAAKVPILVAVNKIDKPEAQPERVKQQLADRGLLAEDWGGDTVMVPVSAKAKTNLDLLLEMIGIIADMQENKANATRPAVGTVLEAKLDRGQGPVATVLVQNGTLRVGDFFIVGSVFGKVRALLDDRGEQIREAGPSTPVVVLGLEDLPAPGDSFQVVTDTAKAKQIVEYREAKARETSMAKSARMTLEHLHEQMREGEMKELAIILKADVTGSVEVLSDTLNKLSTDKVKMRLIHTGVGAISESDVLLAAASNAIIIGFSVRPERTAAELAQKEKVDIRLHTIIYEVTDEIKKAMAGLLEPVIKEVALGKAEVRQTFRIPKVGAVAGCYVQEGRLTRDAEVRLLRDNVVVYTGRISSLRRFKDDVSEVKNGFECGVTLSNYSDIKQSDIIEAFQTQKIAGELSA